jgi:hypothetical protein
MSLPEESVAVNTLPEVTTIPTGKKLIFTDPDTNEGGIITLENLTKQILQNLTTQTFGLDQGNLTLLQAINQLNSKSLFASKWIYLDVTTGILSSLKQLKFSGTYRFNEIDEALLTDSDGNKMNDLPGDYYAVLMAQDFTNNGGVAYGTLLLFSPRIHDGFWYCNIWASKIRRWRKILLS